VLVSALAAGIGRASGSSWLSSKSLFEKLICYEINNAGQFCKMDLYSGKNSF